MSGGGVSETVSTGELVGSPEAIVCVSGTGGVSQGVAAK